MKLYRYMSDVEFQKLTAGCDIIGKREHFARTSSSGVCFLGEVIPAERMPYGELEEYMAPFFTYEPEQAFSFLSGIVAADSILVEFEVENDTLLVESGGVYADPEGAYYDRIVITEYCMPYYNRDMLTPVRYGILVNHTDYDRIWYNI